MTRFDPYAPPTWDDIQYEWEGLQKAAKAIQDFASKVPRRVRTRGSSERSATRPGAAVGSALVARFAESNRRKYVDLLYYESLMKPGRDHAMPIAYASTLLEAELDRIVASPVRSVVAALIAALEATRDDRKQAEILVRWGKQEKPTMLGILSTLFLAMRKGLDQNSEAVHTFVRGRFADPYPDLLRTKEFDRNLNYITRVYRNPACHGVYPDGKPVYFEADQYKDFVRRVVAHERFRDWDRDGPQSDSPGAGVGLLHHHLRLFRDPDGSAEPTAASPLDRPAKTS
jgi:hypothetical protein